MKTEHTAVPKLFIGIDIHKRSWQIHCSTDLFSGKSFSMAPDAELLRKYVDKHFSAHEVNVVYQAGCCGYHTQSTDHTQDAEQVKYGVEIFTTKQKAEKGYQQFNTPKSTLWTDKK